MLTRRRFFKLVTVGGVGLMIPWKWAPQTAHAAAPRGPRTMVLNELTACPSPAGGTLAPCDVPKYVAPLVKPPVVRRKGKIVRDGAKNADLYVIGMRQFQQQILPPTQIDGTPIPPTTVWSYGPANAPVTDLQHGFFYPAFTIENKWRKPAVVKWVNQLRDGNGNPLPHLLPVDPTLHWANPIGMRDMRPPADPDDPYWDSPHLDPVMGYTGPVPMVTHVHGAHTHQESDGYPEAWYLPKGAGNVPGINHTTGTFYDEFNPGNWKEGWAKFEYPNDQRATTLWYHDHSLGMTRVNVYAGPAGFYLIRGGPDDSVLDSRTGMPASLPSPAPGKGIDPFGTFYEIPIAIQDRSFNADGSLFYPNHRAFFEGLEPDDFAPDFPFTPDLACDGQPSDVAPIWQPEFFGNMMVVNGQTWPYLDVEQRRYRFRLLNGCNSRFLILDFSAIPGVEVWQIGAEGGFLATPVQLNPLLMGPAERADVIVDFTNVPEGNYVLKNVGPDEPFGGGVPDDDFDAADPESTGQVMQLRVGPAQSVDETTPPQYLQLPPIQALEPTNTRQVSLNEEESHSVLVRVQGEGEDESWVTPIALACDDEDAVPFGPTAALLGTQNPDGTGNGLLWMDPVTENPGVGDTEEWEIYNHTMDAHPIHVHLVQFQVVGREPIAGGTSIAGSNDPLPWETGFKDTVLAYPGEITRIKARFDIAGLFVWHCHIVEHEDNEMMRPYRVGPEA